MYKIAGPAIVKAVSIKENDRNEERNILKQDHLITLQYYRCTFVCSKNVTVSECLLQFLLRAEDIQDGLLFEPMLPVNSLYHGNFNFQFDIFSCKFGSCCLTSMS